MRAEGLNRVKVDIVGGQETWDKVINVDGYKWFGKSCVDQRGEGGVGFLVRGKWSLLEMLGMRRVFG